MEIDFHFGATYAVARIAGFDHRDAEIVATCSQYVDDTVNSGPLRFKTGESFYRISTAHETHDYRLFLPVEERKTWVPFHFLPGNDPRGPHELAFFNRIICRPHSEIAKEMARTAIAKRDAAHGLHRLGITAHVFIDTWAHQGFAGVNHPINMSSDLVFVDPAERPMRFARLLRHGHWRILLARLARPIMRFFTDRIFPMGHGSVLHYPDHPFRRWRYTDGLGQVIERDNPRDFLTALDELCKVFRRFKLGDGHADVAGLPDADRQVIAHKIATLRVDDPQVRLAAWLKAIAHGEFSFGPANAVYAEAGPSSWKMAALGVSRARIHRWERFEFKTEFMGTNWKLFHDAAQAHQADVLHEILPRHGICAI